MKLLLDTHLLLWAAEGFEYLPPDAQTLMNDPENELFFSVASLWEIVIKCGLGRKDFLVDPRLLRCKPIHQDKGISGTIRSRPALTQCLAALKVREYPHSLEAGQIRPQFARPNQPIRRTETKGG